MKMETHANGKRGTKVILNFQTATTQVGNILNKWVKIYFKMFLNTLYARCGRDRADRYNEIVELRQTGSN